MPTKQGKQLKSLIEEHLRQIVEEIGSREIGSPENVRTRSYIAAEVNNLGLSCSEHTASIIFRKPINWDCTLRSSSGAESISILPGLSTLSANYSGMKVLPNIYETKEDFEKSPPAKDTLVLVKLGTLHEADMCRLASPAAAVGWFREGHPGLYSGNCMNFSGEPLIPGFAVSYEDAQRLTSPGLSVDLKIEIAESPINISNLVVDIGDVAGHPCFITHYDSRRCSPGANDNATGVACLLAALSIWTHTNPARFIFFDAEEAGATGSRNYVEWLISENKLNEISCVVCPDSVGLNELHLYTGDRFGKLSEKMIVYARQAFHRQNWNIPERSARSGSSDYANFHKVGIPCLFLSDFPNEVRHTTMDNLSHIDSDALVRLAHVFADPEFYINLSEDLPQI